MRYLIILALIIVFVFSCQRWIHKDAQPEKTPEIRESILPGSAVDSQIFNDRVDRFQQFKLDAEQKMMDQQQMLQNERMRSYEDPSQFQSGI